MVAVARRGGGGVGLRGGTAVGSAAFLRLSASRGASPRTSGPGPSRARGRVAVALDRRVQVFMLAILTLCLPSVSKAVFQSLLGSFVHPFMHRRACMCTLGRSFPTPPHRNPCSRRFPGPTPPHRNPCSRSLLGSLGGLAGLNFKSSDHVNLRETRAPLALEHFCGFQPAVGLRRGRRPASARRGGGGVGLRGGSAVGSAAFLRLSAR